MKHSPILLSALTVVLAGPAHGNDWPGFRGPHGDNSVPEARIARSFPESGPKILWKTPVHEGYGGAAVAGQEVFILDRVPQEKDILRCVGLADGKERWKWEYPLPGRMPHPGSRMVPTVTENAVYATSGFGHVYCIDRKTHKERWVVDVQKRYDTMPPRFGYSIHPVIHGDKCLIAPTSETVGMAALDIASGKELWRSPAVGSSHSSPVVVKLLGRDIALLPGSSRGTVMLSGVDPDSGKELFRFSEDLGLGLHNAIPNVTVIDDKTVFLTGGYGQGTFVLRLAEKEESIGISKAGKTSSGSKMHPVLIIGEQAYMTARGGRGGGRPGGFRGPGRGPRPGGGSQGRPDRGGPGGGGAPAISGLVCMDLAGEVLWSTGNEPGLGEGSLISAGGIIISQDGGDGTLRLIEPGPGYKELAKGEVFDDNPGEELWAPLALSNGKLLMRSQKQLVCVDLAE